jgi:5-methyltetrahydropteroyltriglutamate--homocysteine methyltransferase
MINDLVAGFPGVKFAVHLCRRAGARVRGERDHAGGYDPIISQLNRLKVQHLTMEFATTGAGGMSVFRELRPDFEIGLGCVSVDPGEITSCDAVVHCVTCALEHLDAGRVTLNPDCGFAPGSGAVVDIDEVYQKLRIETAAAARLRELFPN